MNEPVFSLYFSWHSDFVEWQWAHRELLKVYGYFLKFEAGGHRADFYEWGQP